MAKLILFKGTSAERVCILSEGPVTMGRQPSNTIQILDAMSSRVHCRIAKTHKGYELTDLGSRNGTSVNGIMVTKTYLSDGDQIRIGNAAIHFEDEEGGRAAPSTVSLTEESEGSQRTIVEASLRVRDATLLEPGTEKPDAQQLRRAEKALSLLYEGAQLLSSRRNREDLLDAVTGLALDLTGGDRAFIALLRPDGALETKSARPSHGDRARSQIAISKTIANVALGEKNAVLCSDAQRDTRFRDRQSIYMHHIRSALYVPLVSHDEVLGILGVDSVDPIKKFTKENLRHLSILTNHAAAAVDNLRLLEEAVKQRVIEQQLEIAREIQQNFLPADLTIVPQVELAASSLPAMVVGGDFYDCIPIDTHRTALVIGDVSGKGIPAGLCMGRVMGDLKSQVALHEKPGDVLASLNESFIKRSTRGMFITMVLLKLDSSDMTCAMCNAGHPHPILLRKDSPSVDFIEERGGPMLGVVDDAEYSNYEFSLAPGDMLFLYTDGITEAHKKTDEFFGRDRLVKEILSCREAGCQEIIETVFDRVTSFAGAGLIPDDLTMMVLRIKTGGSA